MIDYRKYDCMCWEKDGFGKTLCCDPPICNIAFCPVKKLLARLDAGIALAKRLGPSYQSDRFIEVLNGSEFTTKGEEEEE